MSSDFASSYGEDLGGLRLSSQRFDPSRFEWFSDYYAETESMIMEGDFDNLSAYGGGDELPPPPLMEEDSEDGKLSGNASILPPMEEDAEDGKLSGNVQSLPPMEEDAEDGKLSGNAPILPPPAEMEGLEGEGFSLREWRRQTVFRLEEKERREKEILKQIIKEADAYKAEYYKKWKLRCENSRTANREKEKLFLESREKFHAEADKNYWMAISELIPKEVVPIGKKEKKDKGKKPSIVVIQGPKPGKPTDLSRMRQVLVKLKHNPPHHMLPPPVEPEKNAKIQDTEPAASALMSGKLPTTSDSCLAVVK